MKGMTDICVGPMSLDDIKREIEHYLIRLPSKMVVRIETRENDFFVRIYIPIKDFTRR